MAKKSNSKSPKKKSPETIETDRLNAWVIGQEHFREGGACDYDSAKDPEAFAAYWDGYYAAAAEADRERLSGGNPPGQTDEEDSEEARWA